MDPETRLLGALRAQGLSGITRVCLTRNRTVMVSRRGAELRVQAGYLEASPEVLRAIVEFVNGRGVVRRRARLALLAHPVARPAGPVRREVPHPDDDPVAERLREAHERLNAARFGGVLSRVPVRVSRRMRSRLGHYRLPSADGAPAEIVISRRHIRRHGWGEAEETLLHEMVHQWQHEQGWPVDHGRRFRDQARAVGVPGRARRAPGSTGTARFTDAILGA